MSASEIDEYLASVAEAEGYDTSQGTLRFAVDTPLPKELVQRLLDERIAMLDRD